MPTTERVTKTGKDSDGDILCLCRDYASWSPRSKASAISDIESHTVTYYVQDSNGNQALIEVVDGPTGKYLRSNPNSNCSDNLSNLPDCTC